MPAGQQLPLAGNVGDPWFELTVPLLVNNVTSPYMFEFRWNQEDSSWYFDLTNADDAVICTGLRVRLGVYMGARTDDILFRKGALVAIDTTEQGLEAGLDDLGDRVIIVYFTDQAIITGREIVSGLVAG